MVGCNTQDEQFENVIDGVDDEMTDLHLKGAYIPSAAFDWETETFISWQGAQILLPWASGSNNSIPLEIKNDFSQIDGWKLLYNNFPYSSADPVLILYNVYTGMVRVFMYVTTGQFYNNSFTWGFGAETTVIQTAVMNFTRIDPQPSNITYTNPTSYNLNYSSDPNTIPTGIAPNYWYYSEFETMYDPQLSQFTHDNIEFKIKCFATDKKFVKLQGTITGSISGTFTLPSSSPAGGMFTELVSDFDVSKIGKIRWPTKDESKAFLKDLANKQLNSSAKALLNQGLTSLGTNLLSTNPVIKFLTSGLLTTSSSTPGKINCSLKAKTTNDGTITSVYPGPSISFKFPGTAETNKGGLLPNYDSPLGVWCISNKPTVKYSQNVSFNSMENKYDVRNTFTIDNTSFNVVINPAVTNLCSSVFVNKYVAYKASVNESDMYLIQGSYTDTSSEPYSYIVENSMLERYFYDYPKVIQNSQIRVRVKVTLYPIGKSDPIILIKEFVPNLIEI